MDLLSLREPVSALTHGVWMLLAVPATVLLWQRCQGDQGKRWSLLVFGLSAIFCFGASALYHGTRSSTGWVTVFDRLDHLGIYTLIAGSYTPLAWNLLRTRWRLWTLSLVWLTTAVAAVVLAVYGLFPPWISTGIYVAMGWACIACYAELARRITPRAMLSIALGGLFYTVGAALNLLEWPVFWPGVFGPHEVFHLFVMAGSLSHYWFMLHIVAPFTPGTVVDQTSINPEPQRSSCSATLAPGPFGS
ncbi:MAG: hemolysin III family protein [Isosphaeraceae bacterium]